MDKRKTILVIDDSEFNRSVLKRILSTCYNVIEALCGVDGITVFSHMRAEISLVILNMEMRDMSGIEVMSVMRDNDWLDSVPVLAILRSSVDSEYINKVFDSGVSDYITDGFDDSTVKRRVFNAISLQTKQNALENMVAMHIVEREHSSSQLVEVLSNIVEFRNGESGAHVIHIRTITDIILQHLRGIAPQYNLTAKKISLIANASAMHDIGKISISMAILNKPGRLTPEEYETIKTHSMAGAMIIESVPSYKNSELLQTAYSICRWHHERYDGKGYPDGLCGEDIPISAQAVALADVYDSLISKRCYKPMYSHEKALRMIVDGECGTFSPLLIRCLLECGDEIRRSMNTRSIKKLEQLETERATSEIIESQELMLSAKTLALLEQEREKIRFYSSMSKEILFEYNKDTQLLELSEWGANYLGIPQLIHHPIDNPEFPSWAKSTFSDVINKLSRMTHASFAIKEKYNLPFDGTDHWFKVIVRPLWESADTDSYTCLIGKIINIDAEVKAGNELKELSDIDKLTVLYNRRAAEKLITSLLSENRESHNYAMILIDIDSFRQANDMYGHAFGDSILRNVSKNILKCIRQDDVAARIGGDEFLLFVDCNDNPVYEAARLFREVVYMDSDYTFSISMGVSVCRGGNMTFDELMHSADVALHTAKSEGKNSFRFYDTNLPDLSSPRTPIDGPMCELQGGSACS